MEKYGQLSLNHPCYPFLSGSTDIVCLFTQRNGADYCVYLNTASEFDGSDSGARPDEAVSWGKIKKDATPVKVLSLKLGRCLLSCE